MTRLSATRYAADSPHASISVAAARERFAGEWVLMRVDTYDEHHNPAAGSIVAHSTSDRAVYRWLDRALVSAESKARPYYLFSASMPLPSGTGLREALAAEDREVDDRGWLSLRRRGR